MKKKFYTVSKLSALALLSVLFNLNQSVQAQCSVNAGEDVQSCTAGSITLEGTYVASPTEPVVDINQNQINTCMAFFDQEGIAQSFTATSSSICGAGLTFEAVTTGSLTINLWTNLPNDGGTLLATGTAMVTSSNEGNVFWNSVELTVGTVYFLEFATSAPEITTCISGSTSNPYAGGNLYANNEFQPFLNFDYGFRTNTCPPAADITWEGPNITDGVNTTSATINPPLGVHTYTMTVFDPVTNCTASDQVVVTRGENVSTNTSEIAIDSYTWNGVTYTETGQYTQVLESSLGCDSTVTLTLILGFTDIENFENSQAKIYPNPTTDLITIAFDSHSAEIELLDASGRNILSRRITSGETISLAQEPSGVFFVRMTTEDTTRVYRIIKQ